MLSELARLYRSQGLDAADYHSDVAAYDSALAAEKRLQGTRRTELTAVTETMHGIAASGQLTVPPAGAVPDAGATSQWWTTGPLLAADQRVEFAGSQLVWEYYPGQGIQLQVLGDVRQGRRPVHRRAVRVPGLSSCCRS